MTTKRKSSRRFSRSCNIRHTKNIQKEHWMQIQKQSGVSDVATSSWNNEHPEDPAPTTLLFNHGRPINQLHIIAPQRSPGLVPPERMNCCYLNFKSWFVTFSTFGGPNTVLINPFYSSSSRNPNAGPTLEPLAYYRRDQNRPINSSDARGRQAVIGSSQW